MKLSDAERFEQIVSDLWHCALSEAQKPNRSDRCLDNLTHQFKMLRSEIFDLEAKAEKAELYEKALEECCDFMAFNFMQQDDRKDKFAHPQYWLKRARRLAFTKFIGEQS